MEDNVYESISEITEFNDISDFMGDEILDEAMAKIIKIIAKPDIPPKTAAIELVRLQAMAAKFNLQAKYWMLYEKGESSSKKKNTYLTVANSLEKLADSLKYLVRQ